MIDPCCFSCGRTRDEIKILRRYDNTEIFEFWCEPCVSSALREHASSFYPQWLIDLARRFDKINRNKIPWRERLRNWIWCVFEIKRQYQKIGAPLSQEAALKTRVATWHIFRYKLMYEESPEDKLVYLGGLGGIECIYAAGILTPKGF